MIVDAVQLVHTYQLPAWRKAGWDGNIAAHRLCGYIDDAKVFRTNVPAIVNLNPLAVCGDAEVYRIRRNSQPELYVMVQLRADALEIVQALRERGPAPGTLAGVIENGVLTSVSVNAGVYRALALNGGL